MWCERTYTGLIIHQPTKEVKRAILMYFSLKDPVREYFIYSGRDPDNPDVESEVIYVTSGALMVRDYALRSLSMNCKQKMAPTPKTIQLGSTREPRSQLQIDCINKLTTSESRKITIQIKPGTGKTFISLYSISKLGLKPLIICPTTNLKAQWIDNFITEGIPERDIATDIFDAEFKKICIITISSVENAIRDNWRRFVDAVSNGEFGIKIIDEAHLHLKGVMRLDALCNIKHNWYLSATLGRSDNSEDSILNRNFLDAERFIGNAVYDEYKKEYVKIYLQDIHYHPAYKLCAEKLKFGKKGLIKSSYYKMLLAYKNGEPFFTNILTVLKRCNETVPREGKILVLVPLLEIIDNISTRIAADDDLRQFSVGFISSKISQHQKEMMFERDIILSTAQSVGTGVDIQNLKAVINFDQYASPIITEQIVGRLRDRGEECHYFDICDYVEYARSISNWGRKRRSFISYFPGVEKDMKQLPTIYC